MKFAKKIVAILMVLALAVACLAGCDSSKTTGDDSSKSSVAPDLKIGLIYVGDENEGYTYAHMDGVKKAAEELGLSSDQIIEKKSVAEDETCYDAACDLAEQGCTYIFSNSYSHQSYMVQAAQEYPDVTFLPATGDTAAVCGLDNVKNYFTNVYESRYVSGVVAGMKVKELVDQKKLSDNNYDKDGNVKIGYVGAYPYAEVVSGYTAFYLGIKSVYEKVSMEVTYTNSWFDQTAEGEAANALMSNGDVIIGQHADSTGAPSAVQAAFEKGTVAYSVGYNVDMLSVAPDAALTSSTNVWEVYYKYAFDCAINGKEIDTDWSKGYNDGAVAITDLGDSCAEDTADKVKEVETAIKDGTLHVFDTSTFTVDGKELKTYKFDTSTMNSDFTAVQYEGKEYETIEDGYFHESEFRAAPYFDIRIDGITELNAE